MSNFWIYFFDEKYGFFRFRVHHQIGRPILHNNPFDSKFSNHHQFRQQIMNGSYRSSITRSQKLELGFVIGTKNFQNLLKSVFVVVNENVDNDSSKNIILIFCPFFSESRD